MSAFRPARRTATVALLSGLLLAPVASAVGKPSTYAGCATRNVGVSWGGSVAVDLAKCHTFGLGDVSQAPAHGTATPGKTAPVNEYVYSHKGTGPAGGGSDTFVVLDDNSDLITVKVSIRAPLSSLTVSPATLPEMKAGSAFEQKLDAGGGTAPYVFGLASGTLPAGVTLSPEGVLAGTPAERGAFDFMVVVTDAKKATANASFGGEVAPAALSLDAASTRATAVHGVRLSRQLVGAGGVAPYRFMLEPGRQLPAGLGISESGVVSGVTAVAPGNYPVAVRVTDSSAGTGTHFEVETFTLRVVAAPVVSIGVSPDSITEDGPEKLVYTVTRDAVLDAETVVNLSPSGTARFPRGPEAASTRVVIPAGAGSASFVVRATPDRNAEPDRTATFGIATGAGYRIGTPASATGTIVDDD